MKEKTISNYLKCLVECGSRGSFTAIKIAIVLFFRFKNYFPKTVFLKSTFYNILYMATSMGLCRIKPFPNLYKLLSILI